VDLRKQNFWGVADVKTKEELKPNYGPVYAAAVYPGLCKIFHNHGYALAVHGSVARDFDVIAIPWTESVSDPDRVLAEITSVFAIRVCGDPTEMRYGRMAYTLSIGHSECACDLSFFPPLTNRKQDKEQA